MFRRGRRKNEVRNEMCCKDNADCYAEGPLLEPLWPLRIIGGRECNNRQVDGEKGANWPFSLCFFI